MKRIIDYLLDRPTLLMGLVILACILLTYLIVSRVDTQLANHIFGLSLLFGIYRLISIHFEDNED